MDAPRPRAARAAGHAQFAQFAPPQIFGLLIHAGKARGGRRRGNGNWFRNRNSGSQTGAGRFMVVTDPHPARVA